jgi:hypothetical protein
LWLALRANFVVIKLHDDSCDAVCRKEAKRPLWLSNRPKATIRAIISSGALADAMSGKDEVLELHRRRQLLLAEHFEDADFDGARRRIEGILAGIIDASLLRKAMQSCSGVDSVGLLRAVKSISR